MLPLPGIEPRQSIPKPVAVPTKAWRLDWTSLNEFRDFLLTLCNHSNLSSSSPLSSSQEWPLAGLFQPHSCSSLFRRERRDSSGLDGSGSILARGKVFSLLHSLQTGPGAHPSSYPMDKGKVISVQAVEAHRIARGWGSHIFRHSAHRWREAYPIGTGGYFPGGETAEAWSRPLTSI
jgi:hypothetical protein